MSLIEIGTIVAQCPGGDKLVQHSMKATLASAKEWLDEKVEDGRQRCVNTMERLKEQAQEVYNWRWTGRHLPALSTQGAADLRQKYRVLRQMEEGHR